VSVELCGGNHVERTGDIGSIALLSDEALGSGVRRIEAVVGMASVELFRTMRGMTKQLAQQLSCPVPQIPAKVEKLAQDVKDAKAALQKALKASSPKIGVEELVKSAQILGGKKIILADMQQTPEEQLTGLVDTLRVQQPDALVVLVRIEEDGVGTVLTGAGDVAIQQGGHAGNLAKEIGKKLGSGGGGKPTFARAGFKNADFAAVEAAVKAVLG
jgi:alanyl-tRNA synthetase